MSDALNRRIRRGLGDLPLPADPGFDAVRSRSRREVNALSYALVLVAVLAAAVLLPRVTGLREVGSDITASPTTLVEAFGGAGLDPRRWSSSTSGIGPSLVVSDDHLTIRIPADAHEDAVAPGLIAGSLVTRCAARGDYDVQVRFALPEWQPNLGVMLVLREAAPASAAIMRGQVPGDVYATTIAPTPNTRTSDRSGGLRLIRSGPTVSSYYLQDGEWARLASAEAPAKDVAFELTLWTDDAARTGQRWRTASTSASVAVALDDFVLSAATLVCS